MLDRFWLGTAALSVGSSSNVEAQLATPRIAKVEVVNKTGKDLKNITVYHKYSASFRRSTLGPMSSRKEKAQIQ
jgi:hypothetical protein